MRWPAAPHDTGGGPAANFGFEIGAPRLVFEQDLGAVFSRISAPRCRLHLNLIGRYSCLPQRGGDRLSTVESGAVAVQLLHRTAATAGIADDANFPRVLLVDRQDRFEGLLVFVCQARGVASEFDLG
jgi:hypothetical protein